MLVFIPKEAAGTKYHIVIGYLPSAYCGLHHYGFHYLPASFGLLNIDMSEIRILSNSVLIRV